MGYVVCGVTPACPFMAPVRMRQPAIPALWRQPALLRAPPRTLVKSPLSAKRFHRHSYSGRPALLVLLSGTISTLLYVYMPRSSQDTVARTHTKIMQAAWRRHCLPRTAQADLAWSARTRLLILSLGTGGTGEARGRQLRCDPWYMLLFVAAVAAARGRAGSGGANGGVFLKRSRWCSMR